MPDAWDLREPDLEEIGLGLLAEAAAPAGAQWDNLTGALDNAFTWVYNNVLSPGWSWLTSKLADLGASVWRAVSHLVGFLLKWGYSYERYFLLPAIPTSEQGRFPDPKLLQSTDPFFLLGLMINLAYSAVYWSLRGIIDWLQNRVKDLLGFAAWGYSALAPLVDAWFNWWFNWVRDRVRDLLGFASWGSASLAHFIDGGFNWWSGWVRDRVRDLLGFGKWGTSTLADLVNNWFNWWFNWLWGKVSAAISAIPGVPGNLWDLLTSAANSAASWLLGQVKTALGYATRGFTDMYAAVQSIVTAAVNWLWGQISPAISAIPGVPGNLWDLLTSAANSAASWLWNRISPVLNDIKTSLASGAQFLLDPLLGILKDAFRWIWDHIAEPIAGFLNNKLSVAYRVATLQYGTLQEAMAALLDPPLQVMNSVFGIIFLPLVLAGMAMAIMSGAGQVYATPVIQDYNAVHGRNIPPPTTIIQWLRRGFISQSEAEAMLRRLGYPAAYTGAYLNSVWQLPSVTDLIRMGVREVFTPEIAQRFGQFQDVPQQFLLWAEKVGIDSQWALNYWAAHWDLPSIEQGFEMLHRGVINRDDLELLLRAADVMPYWRDKLLAISYRPVNRVDIRRMFQAGVVDRDRVYQVYLAQGYAPEDASALADWVAKTYKPGGEGARQRHLDLTEAAIRAAYARRLITRDDALERLQDIGYDENEADFILSIWDFDFYRDPSQRSDLQPKQLTRSVIEEAYARGLVDKNRAAAQLEDLGFTPEDAALLLELVDLRQHQEAADLQAQAAVERYRAGIIDEAQLAAELRDLNLPEARIQLLVLRATLQRQVKTARLTLAQLQRALKRGVITLEEFRTRLDAMGYNERDVDILVAITSV
jgi:hypothetical protein